MGKRHGIFAGSGGRAANKKKAAALEKMSAKKAKKATASDLNNRSLRKMKKRGVVAQMLERLPRPSKKANSNSNAVAEESPYDVARERYDDYIDEQDKIMRKKATAEAATEGHEGHKHHHDHERGVGRQGDVEPDGPGHRLRADRAHHGARLLLRRAATS